MIKSLNQKIVRHLKLNAQMAACLGKKPYSNLFLISDTAGWVLDNEAQELLTVARQLGIQAKLSPGINLAGRQCFHYTSHFAMLNHRIYRTQHRLSFDYYHGLPENHPLFAECYRTLCKHHEHIARLRVSQSQMEQLVLSSGIDPAKVCRIPIGVNLNYFRPQTPESKRALRKELNIPDEAIVVGSFQKDGNGWGEGLEPKLIKGPDLFLKAIELLSRRHRNLWVFLTGPARGYVRQGLERLGVPYIHRYLQNYAQVGRCYHALDLYLIASREEGGPKAMLEAMASGVPLITTRVGQAMDLVCHGENAWLVEVEDYEGLARWADIVLEDSNLRAEVVKRAHQTAEANQYSRQLDLWRSFFSGYVEV